MSDLTNVFTDIADAIRAKTQTQITYKPTEMASAINNIETGGGAVEITTGRLTTSFNQLVNIPNGVTKMASCLSGCSNFNQPVNIPNSVTNVVSCFSGCSNFNQPVNIPNSVTNMGSCFYGCSNFNQLINIPNSVIDMASCFSACDTFNAPVNVGSNVANMAYCFTECSSFNQPMNIPASVNSLEYFLADCVSFGSILRIQANPSLTARQMFVGCEVSLRKVIITNNTAIFTDEMNSLIGGITWTQDGSNYYNATYNIYINYSADPFNEPDPVF